jgi:hypothetical protein
MSKPSISLCLSSGVRNPHLLSTIAALSRQTFEDWEVIVQLTQDGAEMLDEPGARHKNLELLSQLASEEPRLRILESDDQFDRLASLNHCLKSVRAPYLKVLHPAEAMHPDALEKIMRNFEENQNLTHLSYEIENPGTGRNFQLFPFSIELESRRAEFFERLFSSSVSSAGLICNVFKARDRVYQLDPNFRFFAEAVFLHSALENGNSHDISKVLSTIDDQSVSSTISPDLQWLVFVGELALLPSTLRVEHLTESFSDNVSKIISALDSEILSREENLMQYQSSGAERPIKGHGLEIDYLVTTLTAASYEKLKQVRALEDSVHLKLLSIEQLKKDQAEKQLLMDDLLKSRIWRYSAPLRGAKRLISRTLFFNK